MVTVAEIREGSLLNRNNNKILVKWGSYLSLFLIKSVKKH